MRLILHIHLYLRVLVNARHPNERRKLSITTDSII